MPVHIHIHTHIHTYIHIQTMHTGTAIPRPFVHQSVARLHQVSRGHVLLSHPHACLSADSRCRCQGAFILDSLMRMYVCTIVYTYVCMHGSMYVRMVLYMMYVRIGTSSSLTLTPASAPTVDAVVKVCSSCTVVCVCMYAWSCIHICPYVYAWASPLPKHPRL
jgi:hypothetical protein